jgi:membrane protease YdiL (CAAX protease family)
MFSNDPLLANASPAATALVVGLYLGLLAVGIVVAVLVFLRLIRHDAPWADRSRSLAAGPLTWMDGGRVALLIIMLVLLTLACASPLQAAGASDSSLMIVQSLLVDAVGLAGIAALLHRRRLTWRAAFCAGGSVAAGADPAPVPDTPPLPVFRAFRYGGLAYLAVLPLIVFAGLVSQGVLSARGIPPSLQEVALLLTAEHSPGVQIYLVFLAIALAPLFEETVFRGVLLPLLTRRLGLGAAVVISSILFSAIHMHLYSSAPLFVIAVGFSLAYAYTGSLWVPVVMHSLFNGVNLALMLILRNY